MLKINELHILGKTIREIEATEGYVNRKGEEHSEKRKMPMLASDTIDDYEEVLELPKYSEEDYKTKVKELIAQKYSIEDELALINNVNVKEPKSTHVSEYDEYMAYREECKVKAKEILNNG